MYRRPKSSASRSRGSAKANHGGPVVGEETRLPLVICPIYKTERVIELKTVTNEGGNQGWIFFKCPGNIRKMPGTCLFYRWQRLYLQELVNLGVIEVNVIGGVTTGGYEETGEVESSPIEANVLAVKIDKLIGAVKVVMWLLVVIVVVGIMYLFK